MGLVEIGVGHRMVGWFFWVSMGVFFFNMGFVPVGFWWAVGSGGLGFSGLIIGIFWVFLTDGFFWVDGLCMCVALFKVWWFVFVCVCVCGDGFGKAQENQNYG